MGAGTGGRPAGVAPGVHVLRTGRGPLASNVYFVESRASWVLVDAGWPGTGHAIRSAAESLFGPGARPSAILLTHIHPDHSGAATELARAWDRQVHVHPAEVAQAAGGIRPGFANPLDRFLIAPVLRLLPRRLANRRDPLADVVQAFDPDGDVPGLPDWRFVAVPGHTPGSVALLRPSDRLLLTGDAVCTTDVNSVRGLLSRRSVLSGPPWISTWDWTRARQSVARLAELRPGVLASGHGEPLFGAAPALDRLAPRMHPPAARETTSPNLRARAALMAASAAGTPLALLARRLPGRWGDVVVRTGCGVLLARDTGMVLSGAPSRLRPLPRTLLLAEVAASAAAVSIPAGSASRTRARRWATAAVAATFFLHTARMAIYVSPGSGRRPSSGQDVSTSFAARRPDVMAPSM